MRPKEIKAPRGSLHVHLDVLDQDRFRKAEQPPAGGGTRQSEDAKPRAEDLRGLSQRRAPSPTQDVSYSQGQPRVKGKQGPGRSRTREGDVTPALSNALAEPEAPTLGGRERRRGSAGARRRLLGGCQVGDQKWALCQEHPGGGLLGRGASRRRETFSECWEGTVESGVHIGLSSEQLLDSLSVCLSG